MSGNETSDRLLTPREVAALFRVSKTVPARWERRGLLTAIRTPGGHRRYKESEVREFLDGKRGKK
jgi:excisionase family DNA binding protein